LRAAAVRTASGARNLTREMLKSDPMAKIVFGRLARRGTAKDSFHIVEFGGLDEGVDDRRTPSSGVGASEEVILAPARDWPNGALGGIVAHYEVAIVGKARQEGRQAFFHRGFLARLSLRTTHASQTRHARMGETATAAPLRRRGLVYACHIVIQNRREPTLDLRDAHAADVTSLSVYGGWVRRSRRAVLRW
jgi:hypothetical protein